MVCIRKRKREKRGRLRETRMNQEEERGARNKIHSIAWKSDSGVTRSPLETCPPLSLSLSLSLSFSSLPVLERWETFLRPRGSHLRTLDRPCSDGTRYSDHERGFRSFACTGESFTTAVRVANIDDGYVLCLYNATTSGNASVHRQDLPVAANNHWYPFLAAERLSSTWNANALSYMLGK